MYKMLFLGVLWFKGVECKYLKIFLKNKSVIGGKCVINCDGGIDSIDGGVGV